MKRVLTFLAVMLLPLSVMAMTPVSDSTLSDVTGQAGVNINADLTMNINIGTMAWGDATGVDGSGSNWSTMAGAGYVGVTGFDITGLRIKARENDTFNGYTTLRLKPITIDVATDTAGARYAAGTTFVRFGLGSLQITLDAIDFDVALGTAGNALTQTMGRVSFGAIAIYIDPNSFIDIYAHSGCGVNFTMDIEVDEFQIGYVSWGDTDGLASNVGAGGVPWMVGGGAGYVGLDNLVIGGPILVNGTVAIDVNTATQGVYRAAHGGLATTVVHIGFVRENFVVDVTGPITADVVLSSTADLATGPGILGDIYISAFRLTIANGSWVDIWAH